MKAIRTNKNYVLIGFAAFVLSLCVFLADTNAQTTRRVNPPKTSQIPTTEVPEVISRADDLLNGNQIINAPSENEQNQELEKQTDDFEARVKEIDRSNSSSRSTKDAQYDKKQKRLLLNLDILSRSEERAESLRKQYFDLIERENQIRTKLDQLDYNLRSDVIERSVAFAGTLRPEELRDQRAKSLEAERTNLENLLVQLTNNKANLEINVQKSDALVEKLRSKLEKDIDDALAEDDN